MRHAIFRFIKIEFKSIYLVLLLFLSFTVLLASSPFPSPSWRLPHRHAHIIYHARVPMMWALNAYVKNNTGTIVVMFSYTYLLLYCLLSSDHTLLLVHFPLPIPPWTVVGTTLPKASRAPGPAGGGGNRFARPKADQVHHTCSFSRRNRRLAAERRLSSPDVHSTAVRREARDSGSR